MMNETRMKAYREQKASAQQRGIVFKFRFNQWCEWWEYNLGPDWFAKRGCRKGQFVMARIGDCGPYAWGNVKCITHSQNVRDGNGGRPPTISAVVVKRIFLSKRRAKELATYYNVSLGTICDIRSRRTRCDVTDGLVRKSLRGRN